MIISSNLEKPAGDKVDEEPENKQRSKYHPFDDQLQYKFYKVLPDHSKIVIFKEEAEEIIRLEKMETEELMALEMKKLQ